MVGVGAGLGRRRKKSDKTLGGEQKIGKYVLGAKIGVGGFGVVRLATDSETGETVAVKILDKAQLHLMEMTTHIKREITLLTTLKHPNIVNGVGILNSSAKLYLFMEYVDGGDLHSLISDQRRVGEKPARRYFYGLMSCLAYCHRKGVHHRDLKLENLLLTKTGDLKVCDFGLASVRDHNSDPSELCSTIVGTEDFAAPEILSQLPYSGEKADMWSAGIILYTIVAGHCPFRGQDTTALFDAIKNCRFSFPDGFPAGAKQVVNSLLVSNPDKRASAQQLLECDWLQEFTADGDSGADSDLDISPLAVSVPSASSSPELTTCESYPARNAACPEEASDVSSLRAIMQENPSLALAAQTIEGFSELYTAMRKDKSLVKDRRWRLRSFPTTFLGEEMVGWIASYCEVSRAEAVAIGDRMLQAEVFHHVCRDHAFKDGYLYYRFAEDTPDSSVLNMRQLWPVAVEARNPLLVSMSVLNSLLALLKIHQAIKTRGSNGHADIDVGSLREDEAFFSFRMAVAELQAVGLNHLQSKSSKMAFLMNILHTLVLHIRIVDESSFRNRNQFWAKTRLEYNIAGTRITVRVLTECLGMDNATETREFDTGSVSSPSLSAPSPRASGTLPSRPSAMLKQLGPHSPKGVNAKGGGVISGSQGLRSPRFTTSLMNSLTRRSDGIQGIFQQLRYEHEKGELLELFVNDGTPSCLPLQVYDENSVSDEALRQRLCQFLFRTVEIDTKKSTMVLPSIMRNYRTISGLFSDRQLILGILGMLENSKTSPLGQEEESDGQKKISVIESIKSLLKVEVPLRVVIAESEDEYFAPEIHVWQFDPGNDYSSV